MNPIANYLTLGLLIIFVISNLFSIFYIDFLITILTLIVIALSLTYCNRINRVFGSVMLTISIFILIYQRAPILTWVEGVTQNLPLLSLIIFVPMLTIPIKLGNYDDKITSMFTRYMRKPRQLYLFISLIYFFLSPMINLGSINIVHAMISKLKLPKRLLGRVYIRSFFTASTWAPYFASVFLVLYHLNVVISDYLLYGLLLSLLQLAVSFLLFAIFESKNMELKPLNYSFGGSYRKLLELLLVLLLILFAIFIAEEYMNANIITVITCIVFIFTIVWSCYLQKTKEMYKKLTAFFNNIISDRSNEIVIFVVSGLFGFVVSDSIFGVYINKIWLYVAQKSMFLTIIMTITLIALLAFIGIHHIVVISIILSSVTYYDLGISDIVMASLLLSAYAISAMVSPVSPANIMVSSLLNHNVYRIILHWNLIYVLLITIVHSITIYLIYKLL